MSGSNSVNQTGVYGTLDVSASGNAPGSRDGAARWTDANGNLWLFGGLGGTINSFAYNDLWRYSPSTGQWTWMSGSNSPNQSGIYGTLGVPAATNVPSARYGAASWTDAQGNLWLFGGWDTSGWVTAKSDLWKYSPSTGLWTWMGGTQAFAQGSVFGTLGVPAPHNIPGARKFPTTWTDASGNFWLFGGQAPDSYLVTEFDDLWKYSPSTGLWTWMGGSNQSRQPGVYGTEYLSATSNMPGARSEAVSWSDPGGNLWLFGGFGFDVNGTEGYLNDLWQYSPSTGLWTWISGSTTYGQHAVYGTRGVAAPANVPGSAERSVGWTDSSGNLWLFSGAGHTGSDFWFFAPAINQWTWLSGNGVNQQGTYGTQGVPSSSNIPGTREWAASWTDLSGNFWLFGGYGVDGNDSGGNLNDLWEYKFSTAATPILSLPSGAYGTPQTVSIYENTAGASVHYTLDGSIPTLSSPVYSAPLAISTTQTVTAIAIGSGYLNSSVVSATYTILTPADAPAFSIPAGTYSSPQTVTLSDTTPGATIYYTLGGWQSSAGPTQYTGPITISQNTTISAYAIAPGYASSATLSATYSISSSNSNGQGMWTWMGGVAGFNSPGIYGAIGVPALTEIPAARFDALQWTDGSGRLWLYGGRTANNTLFNDFWMFDPSTGKWTWISGNSTPNANYTTDVVFGTKRVASPSNTPGSRAASETWIDAQGNLWLFNGLVTKAGSMTLRDDMWKYSPTTNQWTWMSGSGLESSSGAQGFRKAATWIDNQGNFWLFGGESGTVYTIGYFMKYSPVTNQWTNLGSTYQGNYGIPGITAPNNIPGQRIGAASWVDPQGNLWLYGGYGFDSRGNLGDLTDVWKYTPSSGQWTWVSGSPYSGLIKPNAPDVLAYSAHWSDSSGNLWLYGGTEAGYGDFSTVGFSDLWEFLPSTNQWVLINGNGPGATGTPTWGNLGVPTVSNTPGARSSTVAWADGKGGLWLFGGSGFSCCLNDVWEYQVAPVTSGKAALPTISTSTIYSSGNPTVAVTISDSTPGATLIISLDGGGTWGLHSSNSYAFTVASGTTVAAQAKAPGYVTSDIASAIVEAESPAPTFSLPSGYYSGISTLAISDAIPAAIYYSTDGSTPTTSSTFYTGPFPVTGTEVVKAIAAIPSYNNSQVTSATYVVQSSPQITGQWKWVGGSNRLSQSGVYGTLATPAATNVPGAHAGPATWTDQNGNLWLFGGYGRDANGHEGFLNDLWKYVPSAGVWTWMGGNNAINTSGAYGTQGTAAASNVPGARCLTTTWTDANGKLWLLGGYGIDHNGTSGLLNDLWTFDPVSGQWTWMTGSNIANVSGSYGTQNIFNSGNTPGARFLATGWVSGGRLWLFGGDTYDTSGVVGYTNDVWVYDPAQNQWEWVSGSTTVPGAGQALAPTYGPSGELSATNTPGGRHRAASWTDGNGNLWLFGGSSGSTLYGDLWMWDHTAQQWAWIEGGQGAPAGADSLGTFSATNLPPARSDAGTWTDANGNFWLFGGNEGSKVHDLWVFNPKTREWALMNGANSGPGIYGTKGMAAPENTPPPRTNAAAWTDSTGNLWLLGGEGTDSTCQLGASCVIGYENDLWEFQTPTIQ